MDDAQPALDDVLTPREREVIEFLRLGFTNEQIGGRMGISANAVKYHVSEIISKLGVRNRREAARWPERRPWWATTFAPAAFLLRWTEAALPVRLSTAALAISGGAVVAAVAGIGLILFLFLGSNGEQTDDAGFRSGDPRALVDEALSAMDGLRSYRLEMRVGRTDTVVSMPPAVTEFAAPDSNRFLSYGAVGEFTEVCEGDDMFSDIFPHGSSNGQTCQEVWISVSNTRRSVFETIIVGDNAYDRRCEEAKDVDIECEPWKERPRPPITAASPGGLDFPQWPLVAIELAEDFELVGEDDVNGADLFHVRGSINLERAVMENERRVLAAAGITSFDEECILEAIGQRDPGRERVCIDLTFQEALQQREPQLSFYDETPYSIDLWLSPDDLLLHRVELSVPSDDPEAWEGVILVEYSQFNRIEIEAPQ